MTQYNDNLSSALKKPKMSKKKKNELKTLFQVELQKKEDDLESKFGDEYYIPRILFTDLKSKGKCGSN